jgi:hypothetical protein
MFIFDLFQCLKIYLLTRTYFCCFFGLMFFLRQKNNFYEFQQIFNTGGKWPGCREEVSGVPPNNEFTTFLNFLLLGVPQIVILAR